MGGPRLALLGAFAFPYPQGSQIFAAEQAAALQRAGASPLLISYGRGHSRPPRAFETGAVETLAAARWASPRAMRSGPQWGKPLADAALLACTLRAARTEPFAAALAHNAEAALVALAARARTHVPVVYVAHTILRHELSAYAPAGLAPAADRIGARLDAWIARRADAVITLSKEGLGFLGPHARGPVALIPPGLDPAPAPSAELCARVCARLGLEPFGFILYTGNLDTYQELDLLAEAAASLPAGAPPVVVASHDARGAAHGPLRCVEVADFEEVRALCAQACLLVAPRRRPGGFPVKLLNYMEAARPIVAFEGTAGGLEHARSAWLVPDSAGAAGMTRALATLLADSALCERLGAGARRHLEQHHDWSRLAAATLAFVAEVARV